MNMQTTTQTSSLVSRLEVGGILLMVAGLGYINGNFMQPIDTSYGPFIDALHFLPLASLIWLGVSFLRPTDAADTSASARRTGLRVRVTILAVLAALTSVVMIALGAFLPSLNVGVQAFSDWMAVVLSGGGALVWFASLVAARRAAVAVTLAPEVARAA